MCAVHLIKYNHRQAPLRLLVEVVGRWLLQFNNHIKINNNSQKKDFKEIEVLLKLYCRDLQHKCASELTGMIRFTA